MHFAQPAVSNPSPAEANGWPVGHVEKFARCLAVEDWENSTWLNDDLFSSGGRTSPECHEVGLSDQAQDDIGRILKANYLPFDSACVTQFSAIRDHWKRRGKAIGRNDRMIVAITLTYNVTVVTNDSQEFGRVSGRRVEVWSAWTGGENSPFFGLPAGKVVPSFRPPRPFNLIPRCPSTTASSLAPPSAANVPSSSASSV